jgi:hypothetical protein
MTKFGVSNPPWPIFKNRSPAEPAKSSTLLLRPAFARLFRWSRAKVGLISHARIHDSGHRSASRQVSASPPAPNSMTCPR